jgi:hypothetical protein
MRKAPAGRPGGAPRCTISLTLGCLCCLLAPLLSNAGDAPDMRAKPATSRFLDPEDGWLDAGEFLDTAYGFVPVLAPITEPAVGYGLAGALVFVDRHAPAEGERFRRPNIAAVGGLADASSDGTPFYLRPFVSLRGVQALRYQGEQAAEAEVELRWQLHARFSLVGFGGAGVARSDIGERARERTVTAGGAGFRYLIAREHGLHMGLDVAAGPDEPIIYVVFGSAWLRP